MNNEKFASFAEASEMLLNVTKQEKTQLNPLHHNKGVKVATSVEYQQRDITFVKKDNHTEIIVKDRNTMKSEKGFSLVLTAQDIQSIKIACKLYGWEVEFDNKNRQTFVKFTWKDSAWYRIEKKNYGDGLSHLYGRNTQTNNTKYLSPMLDAAYIVYQSRMSLRKKGE